MEKKTRRDKGIARWTERDVWVMPWIAEQYAVRFDHLRRLLSRHPLGQTQEAGQVAEATVWHWIERWRKMGLIGYAALLVGQPGWVWVTRKGMQTLDLGYRPWTPNPARLQHLYYCNEVRLRSERRKTPPTWRAERTLRHEQQAHKKGERAKHLPDAELVFANGAVVAVEVELTNKEPDRLQDILKDVASHYAAVWYYAVPKVKPHIEQAIATLPAYWQSLRERISVVELAETWA